MGASKQGTVSAESHIVISVQHTGTRFLVTRLGLLAQHAYPSGMAACHRNLQNLDGIVPFRHPARVYESWVRRERRLCDLAKQWDCLYTLDEEYPLIYVPVEGLEGTKFSNYGTADIPITVAMEKRVPSHVMDFYAYMQRVAIDPCALVPARTQ